MDTGIIVGEKSVEDRDSLIYDTRKKHVQVDLNMSPPHLDLREMDGGSPLTSSSTGQMVKETLFSIDHNLPFIPKCYVFIYVLDAPNPFTAIAESYEEERVDMHPPAAYDNYFTYEVDETEFRIMQTMKSNFDSQTSNPDGYLFRVKYMITTNDRVFPLVWT